MPVRAFAVEDGNIGSKQVITSKPKFSKDIDLSFTKKASGDIFKKEHAAAVKQAVKNILLTNFAEQTIEIFEPRAVVLNVSTNLRETTNEVKVTVTFRVVNSNETVTTELNLTRLR